MAAPHLSLEGVKVIRSGRTILDISRLDIPPGQFVNLIGANGAGKTTLLKVLCGLLRPQSGVVTFGEVELTAMNGWKKSNLRKQIGYIPQAEQYNMQLPFTVREIVSMGRTSVKPLCVPLSASDYQMTDEWIARLGLSPQKHQTFRSLSGGEQQKVLIARAMVQNPRILMLDEPTSNLDLNWKSQIIEVVTRLHRQMNLTILMISHEINALSPSAERTLLLDAGRILADGKTTDVFASQAVQRIYQCRIKQLTLEGKPYFICQN